MNRAEIRQRSSVPFGVGTVDRRGTGPHVIGELLVEGSRIQVGIIEGPGATRETVKPSLVVLVDAVLSQISGIEALHQLQGRVPGLVLLVLSDGKDHAPVFEGTGAPEVMGGRAPLSADVEQQVMRLSREIRWPASRDYGLTPHETRLLKLLVEGHSYKTAAAELNVTPHTIDFHLRNVYGKLQVHSKSEAVSIALRHHLVH